MTVKKGDKFGNIVVLSDERKLSKKKTYYVRECRCKSCDTVFFAPEEDLPKMIDCGCSPRDAGGVATHAMTGTKIWQTWRSLIARCTKTDSTLYKEYGKKGVKLFKGWMNFQTFFDDVGMPPPDKPNLVRINQSKGYFPGNVEWVSHAEKHRRRKDNVYYEWDGRRVLLTDVARETGIPYHRLYVLVRDKKLTVEKAISYCTFGE